MVPRRCRCQASRPLRKRRLTTWRMRVSLNRRVLITNRRAAARAWLDRGAGAVHTGPLHRLLRRGPATSPHRLISGQEMFALDDLTKLFELTVREDSLAGGLTVTARAQSIVLTPGQSLASVGGRLISLPAPPARDGRSWFVPVDFVPRALGARARDAGRAAQAVAADPRRRRPRAPRRQQRRSPRRARAPDARRRAADAAHGRAGGHTARRSSSRPMRSTPRCRRSPRRT